MQLTIDNSDKRFDDGFFEYLRRFITRQLIIRCNPAKFKGFEEAVATQPQLLKPFRKTISGRDVFYAGVNNLVIKRFLNGEITIEVNPNTKFYGTNTKLVTLVKFLNYGNGDYKGYPIFTDTFDYVNEHLNAIYKLYERTK